MKNIEHERNNIKSTELCERCVYDGENCNLKCFVGEDCKMLDGDSCKCVRVPLRTPFAAYKSIRHRSSSFVIFKFPARLKDNLVIAAHNM